MNRSALLALTAAGLMFGLTVPLSKLALGWLDPTWLAAARFGLAAPVLALVARRRGAGGGGAPPPGPGGGGGRGAAGGLRRDGRAAEPGGRAHERHPRRADLRRGAGARGRGDRAGRPRRRGPRRV